MFLLKNGQAVEGATLLLSVTWQNAETGKAIVRDSKSNIIAELSSKEPSRYFQPALPVGGLSVEVPSGEILVEPVRMTAQMAQISQLPGGSGVGIV